MRYMDVIVFGILFCITNAFAGGAASFAAKKSNTKDFSYSYSTKQDFINDCSQNANEEVCSCVLNRLQHQYSEKKYLKLDTDLRNGKENPEFIEFISNAVNECDANYAELSNYNNESFTLPEEAAKAFVVSMFEERPKNIFVPACASDAKKLYGEKMAKKVCGCAYNHMVSDTARFVQMVMNEGYPDESNPSWGAEYMIECAPDEFTPEMEKNLVNTLNQGGLPKSISQCFVKVLKKEYSVKAYLAASIKNNEETKAIMALLTSKCFAELGQEYNANQTTSKTILGGRRGKSAGGFNEGYAEGGSDGIGDGFAGLLGGGGGIATKAKGSIKTPSERDINIDAGGGSRSAADIMKVVRQRTPGLRHIYNKFLKKKPSFQGKVILKFTIAPGGEIISISIASSTTGYNEFDEEVKTAVSRWKFSKVKSGNTTVTIPFPFSE